MKSLTHNHAFAQVDRIFFIRKPTHFDCVLSKYAIYPTTISTDMGSRAHSIALSTRISTSGLTTRT